MNSAMYYRLFFVCFLFSVIIGCTDSYNCHDCPKDGTHSLIVKSFDGLGTDGGLGTELTGTGAVKEVKLYLFDNNYNFLDSIITQENTVVPLNYPFNTQLRIVGWGNSFNDNIIQSNLLSGTSFDDRFKSLLDLNETTTQTAEDLFYGKTNITLNPVVGGTKINTLNIYRKVACISVKAISPNNALGGNTNKLLLNVNNAVTKIDFNGNITNSTSKHVVNFTKQTNDEWMTHDFYILPSSLKDHSTNLTLLANDQNIETITQDDDGNDVDFQAGQRYLLTVNFSQPTISVIIKIIPWNSLDINQEFKRQ